MFRLMYCMSMTCLFWARSSRGAEWALSYAGGTNDEAAAISATSDGGYVMAGNTSSFWVYGGDFWIVKIDSSGSVEWQKTYGGGQYDDARSIEQTADGGYIVLGHSFSFSDAGDYDLWVLKLDKDGSITTIRP